jgi:hypothetical protein
MRMLILPFQEWIIHSCLEQVEPTFHFVDDNGCQYLNPMAGMTGKEALNSRKYLYDQTPQFVGHMLLHFLSSEMET